MFQIESHPYFNNKKLIKYCADRGIISVAYSPLGSPARPSAKPGDPVLLEDPKLKELAKKYNRSVAQIILRYQVNPVIGFLFKVYSSFLFLGN